MKVRTKLILALLLLSAVFITSRYLFAAFEVKRVRVLLQAAIDDKSFTFDKLVDLKGAAIKTFVYEYTTWDEMVNFVQDNSLTWAEANINENTLKTYNADAIWIYNTGLSEVYSIKSRQAAALKNIPFSIDAVASTLLKNRFCHFFVKTQAGLMEI